MTDDKPAEEIDAESQTDDSRCPYTRHSDPHRLWMIASSGCLSKTRATTLKHAANRMWRREQDSNDMRREVEILRAKVEAYELALNSIGSMRKDETP